MALAMEQIGQNLAAAHWAGSAEGHAFRAAELAYDAASPRWRLLRHSGRQGGPESDGWRDTFTGPEWRARSRYRAASAAMRQGGLRLCRPDGRVDSERHAPRLRSRW
jgi:hypothetical protein